MHPRDIFAYERFEEHRRRYGSAVASGTVHEVREGRFYELAQIWVVHRQLPETFAARRGCLEDFIAELVVVRKEPRRRRAERDGAGASQRRDVNYHVGLQLRGVAERVSKREASFGVGVVDLYRLSVARAQNVVRPVCRASGHIFRGRYEDSHLPRKLHQRRGAYRAEHRACPALVALHSEHELRRFYVEAAAVEGKPFADERDVAFRVLGLVGKVYEARRIGGAGGYRRVSAHVFVGDAFFVPYLAFQPKLRRKLLRLGCEHFGVDRAARLVRKVARPALRLAEDASLFERLFAAVEDRDGLYRSEPVLLVAREVLVEAVRGERAALSRGARAVSVARLRHRQRKLRASARGGGAGRREGRDAHALRSKLVFGAEPRYDGPAHRLVRDRHDEQLASLAAEIFVDDDAAAEVAHLAAQRVERYRLRLALRREYGYHGQRFGVEILVLDFDVHLYFLPK